MKNSPHKIRFTSTALRRLLLACVVVSFFALATNAQTTSFTFQTTLPNEITPATGTFEMEFRLFDAATAGTQIGTTLTITEVAVKNRAFAVQLDFGAAAFPGADRFVEISVRRWSDEPFTVIATRTQILSVPYAIRALSAATADNALNIGGVDASTLVQTTDTRLSDSRDPNPGSDNYIQNRTSPQTGANFNIDGNGTAAGTLSANIVDAQVRYNIGGSHILSAPGTSNTFAGFNAGASNTSGQGNAFFGTNAGVLNSSGNFNAIFGSFAGIVNTTGIRNAFFGTNSGRANTTASDNSFFGTNTGFNNTTGLRNAFFGSLAGVGNTTGGDNSFFGTNAGFNNSIASDNSFFGANAGLSNTTGNNNSFFGRSAGSANTTGNFNAIFGSFAGVSNTIGIRNAFFGTNSGRANTDADDNSFFGTNTGFNNSTGLRNSFFGSLAGVGNTTGNDNSFFGVNAGFNNSTAFNNSFFGANAGLGNTTGNNNSFFGRSAGSANTTGNFNAIFGSFAGVLNTTGIRNAFFGTNSGRANTDGNDNSFFGTNTGLNTTGAQNAFFGSLAGVGNTTGDNNSFFGFNAGLQNTAGVDNAFFGIFAGDSNIAGSGNSYFGNRARGANGINNATAIGSRAFVSQSNSLVLGGIGGVNGGVDTNVGIGTTAPADRLDVDGIIRVSTLGAAGETTLCRNASNQLSTCSSSLRYKTNIAPFGFGINLVNRLQPITFNWKEGGMSDLGLGAEDVARVEPLLVTYNAAGEVEGVKYDRIGVVLLNAVNEQQAHIKAQQKQINEQKALIENLRLLVCQHNAQAKVCKSK